MLFLCLLFLLLAFCLGGGLLGIELRIFCLPEGHLGCWPVFLTPPLFFSNVISFFVVCVFLHCSLFPFNSFSFGHLMAFSFLSLLSFPLLSGAYSAFLSFLLVCALFSICCKNFWFGVFFLTSSNTWIICLIMFGVLWFNLRLWHEVFLKILSRGQQW